jgi:hypothetical protein
LANGEVVFKQMVSSSKGEKVAIKLHTDHWKLESDSIILDKTLNLRLIPDGSLGVITGNVKNQSGASITGVNVGIDNDTTITTNDDGNFNIKLPYHLQKPIYVLHFQKKGFRNVQEYYYPKSGNIDVRMK